MKRKITAILLLLALCAGMLIPAAAAPIRNSACTMQVQTLPDRPDRFQELLALLARMLLSGRTPAPQPSAPEPEPDPQAPVPTPEREPSPAPAPEQPAADTMHPYERTVAALVNRERAQAGLPALSLDATLCRYARVKSQDLHDSRYFSHQSPVYGSPFDMMRSFGVRYSYAGENIAMGYASPEAVVDAWMHSEGHRANILSARFSSIGVGYVADGGYWTQWFIG